MHCIDSVSNAMSCYKTHLWTTLGFDLASSHNIRSRSAKIPAQVFANAIASVSSTSNNSSSFPTNPTEQAGLVLNVGGNCSFPGGSIVFGMMTNVTTHFGCGHSETCTVPFNPATAAGMMRCDLPCTLHKCQKKFANKIKSDLEIAGMHCESALRQFGMVEPMLPRELAAAGCPSDMITALLNCQQRSAAEIYLGHRSVLKTTFDKYEACVTNGSLQEAGALGMELLIASKTVQRKLIGLQTTVNRLFATKGSFSAPTMPFSRKEGSDTFEKSWGVNELAALRSSEGGKALLDAPCCNANIVKAKSTILHTQSELTVEQAELAVVQANERAGYFADYPGTEALFASGAMKSSQEMLSDWDIRSDLAQDFSEMDIDNEFEHVVISDNDDEDDDAESIDSSSSMHTCSGCNMNYHQCKHSSSCEGLNMAKVRAYSGKSYDVLTDPWWDPEEA